MQVLDVHTRVVSASRARVFAEIEAMGTPADRLWPAPSMPFVGTPGPMRIGKTKEAHVRGGAEVT